MDKALKVYLSNGQELYVGIVSDELTVSDVLAFAEVRGHVNNGEKSFNCTSTRAQPVSANAKLENFGDSKVICIARHQWAAEKFRKEFGPRAGLNITPKKSTETKQGGGQRNKTTDDVKEADFLLTNEAKGDCKGENLPPTVRHRRSLSVPEESVKRLKVEKNSCSSDDWRHGAHRVHSTGTEDDDAFHEICAHKSDTEQMMTVEEAPTDDQEEKSKVAMDPMLELCDEALASGAQNLREDIRKWTELVNDILRELGSKRRCPAFEAIEGSGEEQVEHIKLHLENMNKVLRGKLQALNIPFIHELPICSLYS